MVKNKVSKEYVYFRGRGRKRSQRKKLNEIDNFEFNFQGREELRGG